MSAPHDYGEERIAHASDLNPVYTYVPRFEAGSEEANRYLEDHGYVVIKEVLKPDEVEHALKLTWDYLEGLGTGIKRHDSGTWGNDRWPTTVHGDILPGHGIGHSAAQWYIRDRVAVKKAFAGIWGNPPGGLLTSFDGMALWRPWAINPEWKTQQAGSWLHIDQHPIGRPGRQCIQGLVTLLPTSPGTGGNVVIPDTHKDFSSIPDRYPKRINKLPKHIDHFRFPVDDPLLKKGPKPIMCHLEAGDLILWDSRTVHCGGPCLDDAMSEKSQKANPNSLLRAVSLICMMPKEKTSQAVLEERKKCLAEMVSTTNWTDVLTTDLMFDAIIEAKKKHPDKYRMPPAPHLNESQLKLVGFSDKEIAQWQQKSKL